MSKLKEECQFCGHEFAADSFCSVDVTFGTIDHTAISTRECLKMCPWCAGEIAVRLDACNSRLDEWLREKKQAARGAVVNAFMLSKSTDTESAVSTVEPDFPSIICRSCGDTLSPEEASALVGSAYCRSCRCAGAGQ